MLSFFGRRFVNKLTNLSSPSIIKPVEVVTRKTITSNNSIILPSTNFTIRNLSLMLPNKTIWTTTNTTTMTTTTMITRNFHAAGSKVNYLDFRYRCKTNHIRLHLLIIRRQKMKKHKRRKFRKKFKSLLAKQRLKREIAKEKAFRVELLTMIRRAETFDPREYALRKISEINNKPKRLSKKEKFEELKELIRKNRYQVTYIKPKHRKAADI